MAKPADEFFDGTMELKGGYRTVAEVGEDDADYFVSVEWIKALNASEAVSEVGLFGNQNSIARPKADKWEHTVSRLKNLWSIAD